MCVCLDWCEMGDRLFLGVCVFVQVCVNAVIPLFHTFASLSAKSVYPLSALYFVKLFFDQSFPVVLQYCKQEIAVLTKIGPHKGTSMNL